MEQRVVDQAIRAAPRYYRTHYIKATLLKQENRISEAEDHFRKSLALWPSFVNTYYGLTEQLIALRRVDEAVLVMRSGVAVDPSSMFGHGNVGRLLQMRGHFAEAACSFQRALHLGDRDALQEFRDMEKQAPAAARECGNEIMRESTAKWWKGEPVTSIAEPWGSSWRWLQRLQLLWHATRRHATYTAKKAQEANRGPENEAWPRPYLSIVVTSRNDNYGGGQAHRFVSHVAFLVHQLLLRGCRPTVELIYVEWNPPDERKPLRALVEKGFQRAKKDISAQGANVCDKRALRVRVVTAPKSLHEELQTKGHLSKAPMAEYFAKNLGIRHTRGEYVLATNFDVVYSPQLMDFLARQGLRGDAFYAAGLRFSTEDPSDALKLPVDRALARLVQQSQDVNRLKGTEYSKTRFFRPELIREARDAYDHVCAEGDDGLARMADGRYWDFQAGDFVVARRTHFEAVYGYPETSSTFGVDSSILCKLMGLGLRPVVLLPPCLVIHQHHQVRVNPNARPWVEPDWLCARVREDPGVVALDRTQRDPLRWGDFGAASGVSVEDLDTFVAAEAVDISSR